LWGIDLFPIFDERWMEGFSLKPTPAELQAMI